MGAPIPLTHAAPALGAAPRFDRVVVIEALTRCNLSCAFCAHDRRLPHARTALETAVLERFLHLLGRHAVHSGERLLVSWLGGEPFLSKAVLALTESAKAALPLHFSATTNGTRLNDAAIREHIRRHYDELTLSVDGLASFHDAMRGRAGVFATLKEGVCRLADVAPALRLRVNVVLMRRNVDTFPALCEELATWGIHEVTFNQLGGRDRPEFYPDNRLTPAQAEALPDTVAALQRRLHAAGVHLAYSQAYFDRILASSRNETLPIRDCQPGRSYLFVSAQGRVAPCAFTTQEYGVDLDTLLTADDVSQLHHRFSSAKQAAQASSCLDCPCTNVHGKFS